MALRYASEQTIPKIIHAGILLFKQFQLPRCRRHSARFVNVLNLLQPQAER
jgi:hypothetical protein